MRISPQAGQCNFCIDVAGGHLFMRAMSPFLFLNPLDSCILPPVDASLRRSGPPPEKGFRPVPSTNPGATPSKGHDAIA